MVRCRPTCFPSWRAWSSHARHSIGSVVNFTPGLGLPVPGSLAPNFERAMVGPGQGTCQGHAGPHIVVKAVAHYFRGKVGQGHQNEASFPHPRVRDLQPLDVHDEVSDEQDVHVEGARSPMHGAGPARPALRPFERRPAVREVPQRSPVRPPC